MTPVHERGRNAVNTRHDLTMTSASNKNTRHHLPIDTATAADVHVKCITGAHGYDGRRRRYEKEPHHVWAIEMVLRVKANATMVHEPPAE